MSYMISILISIFMIGYSLKFMERAHIRERSRLLGKYIRENISENIRHLIDQVISPIILRQLLVVIDMVAGLVEGIEGNERMVILTTTKDKDIQTDISVQAVDEDIGSLKQIAFQLDNRVQDHVSDHEIDHVDHRVSDHDKVSKPHGPSRDAGLHDGSHDKLHDEPRDGALHAIETSREEKEKEKMLNSNNLDEIMSLSSNESSLYSNIPKPAISITDNIVLMKSITESANCNNIPYNIKTDDQEFIKQSLMLNSIKKKLADIVKTEEKKEKLDNVSIDLSDEDDDNDNNNDKNNKDPGTNINDLTNRFVETTEKPIKIQPTKKPKTKTSIEKRGKKLYISVKR